MVWVCRRLMLCLFFALLTPLCHAGDWKLYPSVVHLHGQGARQQILIVEEVDGQAVRAEKRKDRLRSNRPEVVRIDDEGGLVALKDGTATITLEGVKGQAVQVTVSGAGQTAEASFTLDVIPILTRLGCNTGACHGALAGKGGMKLSLRGYDTESDHFTLTRQVLQRRIDLRHPEQSLMLLKATAAIKHGGGQKLEPGSAEYEVLKQWIAAGATSTIPHEPQLKSIAMYPAQAKLGLSASLPAIVQATYTDGRTVDVTRRVKFGSSDEQIIKVTEDGQVTASSSGAAAVTVGYSNQVTSMSVVSPFHPSEALHEPLPVHNYIDQHVKRRLEELRITASSTCTDREFIRRAFLDTIGTLPTPTEVNAFLAETNPQKRAKLIDQLLERPEYIDYWTNKWADLFLISSKKLPGTQVWAFHQFLHRAVADNLPWNELTRRILTAQGSNLENGAANYYVMHKDISDLTETTAITFLGTSITCARCHNHPLDKWTQDQYWSMANLFGRVGLKAGSRGSETIVQPLREGDVLHLRRGTAMLPTPLDGPQIALSSTLDRREHLVKWLTAADNPFFARAVVNRVWRNYLGRGLVESEDDHRQTNPPSNAPLLSALEADFIQHGYDLKYLMKLILNSATYQRSSSTLAGNETDDRYYSHFLIRRLKAEVILDAYSQVLQVPTPFTEVESGGRDSITKTADYPLGTRAQQLPDSRVASRFLTAFGRPEREQVCACEREADATVGQALHVNNGITLNEKLRAPSSRLSVWLDKKISDEEAIRDLYRWALCREPAAKELKQFQQTMTDASKQQVSRREILEDLYWAVLSSREFLFNH